MKINIEVPHTGMIHADTTVAFMSMDKYSSQHGIQLEWIFRRGCLIYDSRDNAGKYLLESDADALLFLDSDMVPPADMLVKLVEADKDIVSALAFRRVPNFEPCIFDDTGFYHDYPEGLIEVSGAGMACCLIKRQVFEKTPQPWFFPEPIIGEDAAFCNRARSHGFKIYCDTTLECGHIGDFIAHSGHYRQWRQS